MRFHQEMSEGWIHILIQAVRFHHSLVACSVITTGSQSGWKEEYVLNRKTELTMGQAKVWKSKLRMLTLKQHVKVLVIAGESHGIHHSVKKQTVISAEIVRHKDIR